MSLYGQYIKEHMGDDIIEGEHGFVSFRFLNEDKTVYIVDIYVEPEYRKMKLAAAMADNVVLIAKNKGATEMLGSVVPQSKNATSSIKVLLAYGMELVSASSNLIIFRKDI